jgi:hypothetical protein
LLANDPVLFIEAGYVRDLQRLHPARTVQDDRGDLGSHQRKPSHEVGRNEIVTHALLWNAQAEPFSCSATSGARISTRSNPSVRQNIGLEEASRTIKTEFFFLPAGVQARNRSFGTRRPLGPEALVRCILLHVVSQKSGRMKPLPEDVQDPRSAVDQLLQQDEP